MCGIVGAVAERNVVPILLEGLRRLEYRGYDSAGVALVQPKGPLGRVRTAGKVAVLSEQVSDRELSGRTGIAHTRWATHGEPNEANAHPHMSNASVAVVHNGIIENHVALREKLRDKGYEFQSETDTEVVAHLVHMHLHESCGSLLDAVRATGQDRGWADEAVHFEYFQNPNEVDLDSSFEVALSRSARTLTVGPGETILDVLRAAGVPVEASCRQGACGTCVVPLLDGRAIHQDVFLSDTQKAVQDRIAVCVSRAETDRLVLEL